MHVLAQEDTRVPREPAYPPSKEMWSCHGVQWFINTNTTHGQEHRASTSEASSSKA